MRTFGRCRTLWYVFEKGCCTVLREWLSGTFFWGVVWEGGGVDGCVLSLCVKILFFYIMYWYAFDFLLKIWMLCLFCLNLLFSS